MIGNIIVGFHMQMLRAYHYQNLPMQYTDIFSVKTEEKIRRKNIYNMFVKTLIVGTCYNRLAEAVLRSTHDVCLGSNIRKIGITL